MNISLTHLLYFRDAANLGSVAAAARNNFVTPSAVSQAIKNLESTFSVKLLGHNKRTFVLTDEGQELLRRCQPLLQEAFNLVEDMQSLTKLHAGNVFIGVQQSFAHNVLPEFMASMRKRYPHMNLVWKFGTSEELKEMLRMRQINIAISTDNTNFGAFEHIKLLTGKYVLVSNQSKLKVDDTIILSTETEETLHLKSQLKKTFGGLPFAFMEVDSWGVIKRIAALSLGVGYVPDYLMRFQKKTLGLKTLKCGMSHASYGLNAYFIGNRQALRRSCQTTLNELSSFMQT
jgi:DNA-binding transcriptional LysR family regulator